MEKERVSVTKSIQGGQNELQIESFNENYTGKDQIDRVQKEASDKATVFHAQIKIEFQKHVGVDTQNGEKINKGRNHGLFLSGR